MASVDNGWADQIAVKSFDGTGPDECCFRHYSEPIPANALKAYKITHPSCPKMGVILITFMDKHVCADPQLKQVQDIMDRLDNMAKRVSGHVVRSGGGGP
ncbi:C-C motif chemokine 18-like [Engraulis encrasicolus]|uniref:C-C motif chemokine 18-like n=1 Tax=Engraulis encrasicolus TaxID=184585 RepID=UPI002FCFB3B7